MGVSGQVGRGTTHLLPSSGTIPGQVGTELPCPLLPKEGPGEGPVRKEGPLPPRLSGGKDHTKDWSGRMALVGIAS